MAMKTCEDCGRDKDESEYFHRSGHLVKICMDCWRKRYVKNKDDLTKIKEEQEEEKKKSFTNETNEG